ncbi:MAG: MMPL family transporter [Chthoniobacterales bacterium]
MRTIKSASLVLLSLFVFIGLTKITFNVDILSLLPQHLKQVQGLSLFLKNFGQSEEFIITLEQKPADEKVSSLSTLASAEDMDAAIRSLAKELRSHPDIIARVVDQSPWESDTTGLGNLLAYLLLNQPSDKFTALSKQLSAKQAPETLQATLDELASSFSPQTIALSSYDPYRLTRSLLESETTTFFSDGERSEFSSSDGLFRIIYVTAAQPFKNYRETADWIARIQNICDTWRDNQSLPDLQFGFTGEPAFVASISETLEFDTITSVAATLSVISLLFWICYRRLKPLFVLLLMLTLTFIISLGLAGIFLQELTVMSIGFAAVMIGLSVDYGYFIYQKSLHHEGTLREFQVECIRNIMWTAGTTSAAFFALNLSSLPGLSQLGSLVAIGVLVAAGIMILIFAPLALRWHQRSGNALPPSTNKIHRLFYSEKIHRIGSALAILLVAASLAVLLINGWPGIDSSLDKLRPNKSYAYDAMDRIYSRITENQSTLNLLISGTNEDQVLQKLHHADNLLADARSRKIIREYQLPLSLWPSKNNQSANRSLAQDIAAEKPRLALTLKQAGFTDDAFTLTSKILDQWILAKTPSLLWPTGEVSEWITRRSIRHNSENAETFLACGFIFPGKDTSDQELSDIFIESPENADIYLISWQSLSDELMKMIPRELYLVVSGLLGLVIILLWIGFRSFREIVILLLTLLCVFLTLTGTMSALGMTWNLFNIAAILLLLGTGIDYGILLLLRLKENNGNLSEARGSLGLIICICAISAVAGFSSISWANHQGLASLGITCALGLTIDAFLSLFLLPILWKLIHRQK